MIGGGVVGCPRVPALILVLACGSFAGQFGIIRSSPDGSELYFQTSLRLKENPGSPQGTFVWSVREGIRPVAPVAMPAAPQAPVYEASDDGSVTAELEPRQPPFCFTCGAVFSDFTIIRGLAGGSLRVQGVVRLSANGRFALVSPSSYRGASNPVPWVPLSGEIKLLDLPAGEERLIEAEAPAIRAMPGRIVTDAGVAVYSHQGILGRQDHDLIVASWNGSLRQIRFEPAMGGQIDSAGEFVLYRRDNEFRGWHLQDGWDVSVGAELFGAFQDLRWFVSPAMDGILIRDRFNWETFAFRSEPPVGPTAVFSDDGFTFFYECATGIYRLGLGQGTVEKIVLSPVVQRALPRTIVAGREYAVTMLLHAGVRAADWQVRIQPRAGPVLVVGTYRKEDALWFVVPLEAPAGPTRVELSGSDALSPFAPVLGPDDVELVRPSP